MELCNVSQASAHVSWKNKSDCSYSKATTFITVLSGWSVFLVISFPKDSPQAGCLTHPKSPMTGILISDYFLVHKQELHIGDLYMGTKASVYWYTFGFNWRAITAWSIALGPLLRTYTFPFPLKFKIKLSHSYQPVSSAKSKSNPPATAGTTFTKSPTFTALWLP